MSYQLLADSFQSNIPKAGKEPTNNVIPSNTRDLGFDSS